jgi:hypothetical protein
MKFTNGSFEDCTLYTFGKKIYGHYFCPVCGCSVALKMLESTQEDPFAINVRAVEGFSTKGLNFVQHDGASL